MASSISEGSEDAPLRSDDNRIHLLRRVRLGKFREVDVRDGWPWYQRRRRRKSLHVAAADRQVERHSGSRQSGSFEFPTRAACKGLP